MRAQAEPLAILDRVPGWAGRRRTVEPLGGGITNQNYRVMVDGDTYVLRVPAPSGGLLGIDREVEQQASRLAAAAGVGPEVIAFIEPEGALITRFIPGDPVSDAAIHLPRTLEAVATALQRIHHAGVLGAAFSPFRVTEDYAETTLARGGSLPAAHTRAREISATIEAALPLRAPLLCHNDLLNANFIDDGEAIRIVDWEYAGMGDPFFDLGNFSVNHQLTEEEERFLLAAYCGEAPTAAIARLRLMRIMSDFREAMWGVLQGAISHLDVDFGAYAARHFDRLLVASDDPRFAAWLGEVGR